MCAGLLKPWWSCFCITAWLVGNQSTQITNNREIHKAIALKDDQKSQKSDFLTDTF